MTQTKHTALPWYSKGAGVFSSEDKRNIACTGDDTNGDRWEDEADEQEANAAFIARACNSHYDLLAQLFFARSQLMAAGYGKDSATIKQMDAAVAKATGES